MRAKQTASLVNKYYENEVTLREQNLPLKYCQPLEKLIYFEEGFRSFHASNIGSAGQRAAKLLAIKFGGLKKVCHQAPALVEPASQGSTPTES